MTAANKPPPDRADLIRGRVIQHTPEQLAEQLLQAEQRLQDRTRILSGEARELRAQIDTWQQTATVQQARAEAAEARVRGLEAERDRLSYPAARWDNVREMFGHGLEDGQILGKIRGLSWELEQMRAALADGYTGEERRRVNDERDTARQMIDRYQTALRFLDNDPDALPGENLAEEAARIIHKLRAELAALRKGEQP